MPRIGKYKSHVEPKLDLVKSWRESGKTEIQIAELLGISYTTLKDHKKKYSSLTTALQASKEKLVKNLKKSLWEEALGYEYEETKTIIEESYLGKKKKIEKTKKKARPQATLLIFALCNLVPNEFQRVDKEAVEELKEEVKKKVSSNEKVNEMLQCLYGHTIKEKEKEKKEKEQKKKEEDAKKELSDK